MKRNPTWYWLIDGAGPVSESPLTKSMHPVSSVWFDGHQNPIYTLTIAGTQTIDGFVLPMRIDLSGASGERVSVTLDRYEVNARFDETLFSLDPPSS